MVKITHGDTVAVVEDADALNYLREHVGAPLMASLREFAARGQAAQKAVDELIEGGKVVPEK